MGGSLSGFSDPSYPTTGSDQDDTISLSQKASPLAFVIGGHTGWWRGGGLLKNYIPFYLVFMGQSFFIIQLWLSWDLISRSGWTELTEIHLPLPP